MSEIWNEKSIVEEKHSKSLTPQIDQFKTHFNMRDFDAILKKLYNKQVINESDFLIILSFINSEFKEEFKEKYNMLVEYATDELKEKYTLYKLKQIKLNNFDEKLIDDLFNNNITSNQKDTIYFLLSQNSFLLTDKLIDDRVKNTLKNNLTEEVINENTKKYFNKNINNPLSNKELMNKHLKKEILDSIPNNYTKLEQSIYIYIKLCQLLSYDSFYYVNKKQAAQIHENISHLSNINIQNSNIVCYEFVSLYAELLESIGIKPDVKTQFWMESDKDNNLITDSFKDNHANLEYIVDNFIISADSTNSILGGDLINAKLGNQLNGIKCKNVNEYDQIIFDTSLNKVYNNINLSNEYKKYDKDINKITFTKRLKLLFDNIVKMDVQEVDFISYITYLKHKFFSEDELQWNIAINIVGKKDEVDQYPVVIFSINTNDIINVPQDTIQYLYDTKKHKLIKYDNQELKELFNSELFILNETKMIPGIQNNKTK